MSVADEPTDADIRKARTDNPKLRERDLAANLGIPEARFVDAFSGCGVRRLRADTDAIIAGLADVGEAMALTRNAFAVHEKTGRYENATLGGHVVTVLGAQIDLRIFPGHWAHAFAVEKKAGGSALRSIQIFDAHGDAVHKVFTREGTDPDAWDGLIGALERDAPAGRIAFTPRCNGAAADLDGERTAELRAAWGAMTDTHQVAGLVRRFGPGSRGALVRHLAPEFAAMLIDGAVETLLRIVANERMPIMVFVRNAGCLQVHSGPIATLKRVGPWFNVMDPGFHLHLRTDRIGSVWAVRKPTDRGDVISVEAFAADGDPVIMINATPDQARPAASDWRSLVEGLSRAQ